MRWSYQTKWDGMMGKEMEKKKIESCGQMENKKLQEKDRFEWKRQGDALRTERQIHTTRQIQSLAGSFT